MEKEFLIEGEISPALTDQFIDTVKLSRNHIVPMSIDRLVRSLKMGKKVTTETIIKGCLWVTNIGLVQLATSPTFHISKIRVSGALTSSERDVLKSMTSKLLDKIGGTVNVNTK